jgi:hypothetical protein
VSLTNHDIIEATAFRRRLHAMPEISSAGATMCKRD